MEKTRSTMRALSVATVVGVVTFLLTAAAQYERSPSVDIELLQPDPRQAEVYAAAGIDLVTLELGWDAYQSSASTTNASYVAQRVSEAGIYRAAGLDVVLDLGLQYPPSWAWNLPGETRFVNQYGERWRGGIGTDVLDAVWNPAVRDAQNRYIRRVAQDFDGLVDRVRVGGLLSGEVRLPPANSAGRSDSLWAFGSGAAAASPAPTWRPGKGSAQDAQRWLDFYMASVADHTVWLARSVDAAFSSTPIDVLLPGWGVRPGDVERMATRRLSTTAVESTGDDLAGGLDWARQVKALHRLDVDITAVTTWLDAPSYGTAPRDLAPVDYLATLTRPLGMAISGENTGGGGLSALTRARDQAERHGLKRITWAFGRTLGTPGHISLDELSAGFRD